MAYVMLVEDDVLYRSLIREVCLQEGHVPVEFDSAESALERVTHDRSMFGETGHPDLVLTDFSMSRINGYEFVTRLRRLEGFAHVPILMVSGAGKKIDPILEAQGVEYHSKSTRVDEIQVLIRERLKGTGAASAGGTPASSAARGPAGPGPAERPLRGDLMSRAMKLTPLIEVHSSADEKEAVRELVKPDSPVSQLANEVLDEALRLGASDVHIEPQRHYIQVRMRVDGVMQGAARLSASIRENLTARIKILCKLNITEKRLPQDGQFSYKDGSGRSVQLRVSTMPSVYGETIVLRVLSLRSLEHQLESLGFSEGERLSVDRVLRASNGLVLTTGPTGSGKTTTLYTMLHALNSPSRNIVTVEDPIEYQLDGITQVQVNPAVGYTFERVLRSFLRQDPDVMLLGEIRDIETAEIALKAAVTGHMVLSTLHTNDAPSAVHRLVSMGLPPYLVAAACRLVIAQRLIRLLCPECRDKGVLTPEERVLIGPEDCQGLDQVWRAPGCPKCRGSGYIGRRAIFEIMSVLSHEMRALITDQASQDQIIGLARSEGMGSLRSGALRMIQGGATSPEEALPHICGLDRH